MKLPSTISQAFSSPHRPPKRVTSGMPRSTLRHRVAVKSQIVASLTAPAASRGVRNVHTGAPVERYVELITHVSDRPGHDRRYAIDARKIERQLGWLPAETFETGIRKTVQWYLANQPWVKGVLDGSYREWEQLHYKTEPA